MIEVKGLTKIYKPKKGIPVKAVDGVDMKIEEKGMVFLLGRSGSGKSTMLNLLGGLDKYDYGEIIVKGKSSKEFTQSEFDSYRNTYVGFIFQEFNILNDFNVGQNIALAMELQGKKATSQALNELLEKVDLAGYASRKPNELSGGQKQRVAIARALIKDPEIILADEPTGALDSNTGRQVLETLKNLSKTKLVIVVSHDRGFAETYGDRIIEMADGKIISDVVRYTASAEEKNNGISIVDDKIVHIKKGYQLTEADFALINEYIAKNESDTYISLDSNINNSMKKAANINEDGGREGFKATNPDEIDVKLYADKMFKLIRSRLPQKNAFKIGASGLKHKPVRLAFTILLSLVAFVLFGISDTMGAYNKYDAATNSIVDNNIDYSAITKGVRPVVDEYMWTTDVNLNEEDYTRLTEMFPEACFMPVYLNRQNIALILSGVRTSSKFDTNFYSFYRQHPMLKGYSVLTQEFIDSMGYKLTGTIPVKQNELVITKYMYESFRIGGYENPLNSKDVIENVTSPSQLIGKTVYIGTNEFVISGVLDTYTDADNRYSLFKEIREEDDEVIFTPEIGLKEYLLYSEMETYLSSSTHSLAYVSKEFTDYYVGTFEKGVYMHSYLYYLEQNIDGNYTELGYMKTISDMGDTPYITLMADGKSIENLADDEIVINPRSFMYSDKDDLLSFSMMISYRTEKNIAYVEKLIEDNDKIITELTSYFGMPDEIKVTAQSILEHFDQYGIPQKIYDEYRETADTLSANLITDEIREYFMKNFASMTSEILPRVFTAKGDTYMFEEKQPLKQKVVGLILPLTYDNSTYVESSVIMTENAIKSLNLPEIQTGDYAMFVGKMPADKEKVAQIVKYSYDSDNEEIVYSLNNAVCDNLKNVNYIIEMMSGVCLGVGIGFAIFAALMMMNFIATSISYKKREIGVLRAVGARSSDVFRIFFSEAFVIGMINWVLSSLGCLVFVAIINGVIKENLTFQIRILDMGIRQCALLFIVSLFVAAVASFLPVMRIARKKPIDAIQNR